MPVSDLSGGAGAVVGEVRWHPHIDDHQVRFVRLDCLQDAGCVVGFGDDVVTGVGEQCCQALAEEHRVLADHDAHGSTASIRVPAPGGLISDREPPAAATTLGQVRCRSRTGPSVPGVFRWSTGGGSRIFEDPQPGVPVAGQDDGLAVADEGFHAPEVVAVGV